MESLSKTLDIDAEPFHFENNSSSNFVAFACTSRYITEDKISTFLNRNIASNNSITLLHVNVRSLSKNFNQLCNLLTAAGDQLTCLDVTETWLPSESQANLQLPGYNFYSKARLGKSGGGVGLYVKDNFNSQPRLELSKMTEYIECIFIEIIQERYNNIIIGCIYRPPNTDVAQFNLEVTSLLGQ